MADEATTESTPTPCPYCGQVHPPMNITARCWAEQFKRTLWPSACPMCGKPWSEPER
jgi:hypothetical protein